MPEWLAWLKWLNPKQWLVVFLRDEIDRQIENRTEVYRHRIEELDQWNKTTKERVEELKELEVEKITKKAELDVAATQEKAEAWEKSFRQTIEWLVNASAYIAMTEAHPLESALQRPPLHPVVRIMVEDIKPGLPPPPPLPTLHSVLGLAGRPPEPLGGLFPKKP